MHNIPLDRLFLGCANFGGVGSPKHLVGLGNDQTQSHRLLDRALDCGIYQLDTANSYGGGFAETYIGVWLGRLDPQKKSKIQVFSKVGNPIGTRPGYNPLSRQEILHHCDLTLRNLGVEQLQCYYVHHPDPKTPLSETVEAFSQLLSQGKIASWGLSNVDQSKVQEFQAAAGQGAALGRALKYIQNQFHYLRQNDLQSGFTKWLQDQGLRYVGYGPLAGGLLSGRYLDKDMPPADSRLALRPEPYVDYRSEDQQKLIEEFCQSAKAEGLTPAQKAIRFVLESQCIHGVILGFSKLEHFEECKA